MENLSYKSKPETYFEGQREDMIEFLPKDMKTMLDVGCGYGNFAYLVKKIKNAEVWGLELNENVRDIAAARIDNLIIGDFFAEFEKFPKNYFDCITFNDVLEHFPYPADALELTKQLLKENGVVVASIPNVRYFNNLFELLIKKDWKYKIEGILDYTHLRFFTRKSIIRMFESLGFEIVSIRGITPHKYKTILKILSIPFFGLLSDTIHLQYAVVAKKKHK